jgi:type VI protein secretion system component VasF
VANNKRVTETQLNGAPPPTAEPAAGRANVAARTAIWTGVALGAAATATVAFFVVRAMWQKRAPDETSERIQSLIDEANRLIRTLEEKK